MINTSSIQITPENAQSYRAAASASANEATEASTRGVSSMIVNPGTHSMTLSNGEMTSNQQQASSHTFNTQEMLQGDGASLLSTAKTAYGSPTINLTKDTLVNHQGMDITLQVAERLGLVKQVNGQYQDVASTEQAAPTPDKAAEDTGESLGSSIEAELGALSQFITPTMQTTVIESVMRHGMAGTNLHDLAFETGQNVEELRGRLSAAEGAFRGQADKALMAAGMGQEDIPAFVKWAQEKHKGAFDDACRNHVYNRSTKGYGALAKAWMNSTMPSADSLPAHYNARKVQGATLVTIPGHPEMALQTATRLGLI
jgi:hypothetical protein